MRLGLVVGSIALTGWNNLVFHNVIEGNVDIPLWTPLVECLQRLGEQWFGEGLGTFLVNPVTYVLIRLVVLLAGVRLPTLGFRKGDRAGWALLVCCPLRGIWLVLTLTSRAKSGRSAAGRLSIQLHAECLA